MLYLYENTLPNIVNYVSYTLSVV